MLLVSKWASSIPGVCSNLDLHTTRGRRACFAGRHRQASFEMEVFRQRKLSLGSLAATLPPRIPVAVQPKPSIPSLCPTRLSVLSNASTSAPIAPQPPATSFCTPDCQAPGTKPSRRRLHSDIIGAAFLVRMQATGSCSRHLSSGDDSSEASSTSTLFSNQGSFLLLQFAWIGPKACDKRDVSFSRWRTSVAGRTLCSQRPIGLLSRGGLVASPAGAARLPIHSSSSHSTTTSTPLRSISCLAKGLPIRL